MRRLALLAALLALAAPATAAAPARLQVAAREFSLTLSRQKLKAGPAVIELVNFGEDAHDLRLRRAGWPRTYGTRVAQPGEVLRIEATLVPGRYRLWCSLGDHAQRGMTASLLVAAR